MRLMSLTTLGLSAIVASFIIACGGGGGSSNTDTSTSNGTAEESTDNGSAVATLTKGYLLDSAIEGASYSCGDIKGLTTSTGEFSCAVAPVTFSIGSLVLGTIDAFTSDNKVYPQDIVGVDRKNLTDPKVVKMIRLLQSLDDDGNIDDRITISSETSDKFDTDVSSLDLDTQVAMGDGTLVSEADAIKHLQSNISADILTDMSTDSTNLGNTSLDGMASEVQDEIVNETAVLADFTLTSTSYKEGDNIPSKYTCRGTNISPMFTWENAPIGTAKYAIIMDDEDSPCGTGDNACKHWGLFNIPSTTTLLAENLDISTLNGAVEGKDYSGPCPPSLHTYKTTLFALKESMPTLNQVSLTRSQFTSTYGEYILDSATISGKFQ